MNRTSLNEVSSRFWSIPYEDLFIQLQTASQGLTENEARSRLIQYGPNILKPKKRSGSLTLLAGQFKSPIILILIFAASLSLFPDVSRENSQVICHFTVIKS